MAARKYLGCTTIRRERIDGYHHRQKRLGKAWPGNPVLMQCRANRSRRLVDKLVFEQLRRFPVETMQAVENAPILRELAGHWRKVRDRIKDLEQNFVGDVVIFIAHAHVARVDEIAPLPAYALHVFFE